MRKLEEEAKVFGIRKTALSEQALQLVAVSLLCGFDLAVALESKEDDRLHYIRVLERAIERERMKGARRHWSYDLNRHIALKQALDALSQSGKGTAFPVPRRFNRPASKSGASRRR